MIPKKVTSEVRSITMAIKVFLIFIPKFFLAIYALVISPVPNGATSFTLWPINQILNALAASVSRYNIAHLESRTRFAKRNIEKQEYTLVIKKNRFNKHKKLYENVNIFGIIPGGTGIHTTVYKDLIIDENQEKEFVINMDGMLPKENL